MAVIPDSIDLDGTIHIVHQETGHTGTITLAQTQFATNVDGTANLNFLLVPCPVCDVVSIHPISGGAAPIRVQRLFARRYLQQLVDQGQPVAFTDLKQKMKDRVQAMDGGRFRLEHIRNLQDLVVMATESVDLPPPDSTSGA